MEKYVFSHKENGQDIYKINEEWADNEPVDYDIRGDFIFYGGDFYRVGTIPKRKITTLMEDIIDVVPYAGLMLIFVYYLDTVGELWTNIW